MRIDQTFHEELVFGLVGVGGFARQVMAFALDSIAARMQVNPANRVCFIATDPHPDEIGGVPCISEGAFFELSAKKRLFNIAITDARTRERLAKSFVSNGATSLSIHAPSAEILGNNAIGEGSIFCGFTSVMCDARIGRYFHANIYSYVSHDCEIGDFVTFGPNVHCNGWVVIQDYVYIGAGALIRQGNPEKPLTIGEGAVVGMGAVVTRVVAPYTTVVGNPARPITKLNQDSSMTSR